MGSSVEIAPRKVDWTKEEEEDIKSLTKDNFKRMEQ